MALDEDSYQLVTSGGGDDCQVVACLGQASDLWLRLVGVRCCDGVGSVLGGCRRRLAKVNNILACRPRSRCQPETKDDAAMRFELTLLYNSVTWDIHCGGSTCVCEQLLAKTLEISVDQRQSACACCRPDLKPPEMSIGHLTALRMSR
jgi:hypothetical protein